MSDDSEADSSLEDKEEEEDSLPEEGERKRKASPTGEAEGSKRGITIPPDSSANTDVGEEEWPSRARPPARSLVSGSLYNLKFLSCHKVPF